MQKASADGLIAKSERLIGQFEPYFSSFPPTPAMPQPLSEVAFSLEEAMRYQQTLLDVAEDAGEYSLKN